MLIHARRILLLFLLLAGCLRVCADAQPLTWDETLARFKANNPDLLAGQIFVEESKANEITAGLRPNPVFTSSNDQFLFFNPDKFSAFQTSQWTQSVFQLIERRRKRSLRIQSANLTATIAQSDLLELERQLIFNLRDAFIRVLQAKSLLALANENLKYYDNVIDINRKRLQAGDIAAIDLTRVELQRAQFESDQANALVTLRSAKITLMALINQRQPVDSFDVTGDFDFREASVALDEVRQSALDFRPDLRSASTAKVRTGVDNQLAWANGSTDPTVGLEYQRTGPDNTMGFSVSVPLRIFDRNQGEKARTELEIRRSQRVIDGVTNIIYRDVDSAYATVEGVRTLLRPYRDRYLPQAANVRDTVSFSYMNGGASLLEFLDAQKSYRDTQLAYRNLVASYLSAVNQLNQAVGKEVM
jgi:cobalt-zinc-cadmium efflux system outer membrane protein